MKKFLLTLILAVFLLWFGGISMADTTVTHHTENVVPGTYTLNWNTGFTAWTITVTDWTTTITILDRNLWATAAWTWCEDRDYVNHQYNPLCKGIDNTYWYLFQWWNNYWFPSHWELSNMSSTLVSSPIDIPYSSSTFITGHDNWMNDSSVVNLWWWTTNDSSYSANNRQITNAQERQWPCPDWFHVPSAWELYKLNSMFDNKADIHEKLLIPFAGYRKWEDWSLVTQGYWIGLMSSSINPNQTINYNLLVVTINNWVQSYMHRNSRSTAQSVRCFYNNYAEYSEPESVQEITNINISWIVDPVLWEYPVTWWITITSTPEGAVHVANSWWSDFNWQTLCNPMWICSNDRDTSYFSNQDSVQNKQYFLTIIYTIDDWYVLADNVTITTNWNWTVQKKQGAGGDYIQITYNASEIPAAAPATPIQISSISITWITLPVGWNIPTKEWIVSATTWITVSNRNTIWNMNYDMVRCSVDTDPELCDVDLPSFVAWTKYNLYIPFTVDDWYVLANSFTATDGTNNAIETDWNIKRVVFQYTATAPAAYTIRWLNYNWDVLETDENVAEWTTPTYDWATPTKPEDSSYTYTFDKWTPDVVPATATTDYTATFTATAKQTSTSSSWWGWHGKTVAKTDTKTDETKAEETKQNENKSENNENNQELNIPERTQEELQKVLDDWLTQEFHDAYDFGHYYWITTMPSAKEADMKGPLTRIAMAKMLSNYAINVLWKKPANKVVPKFPDIDEKLNEDYGWAVDLAYQLWIMWIWIENFRPFDLVPRAEFATALSRMLYGLEDWTDAYYSTHLAKLKEESIISNDNPELQELRWYVMLMLMRSAN